MHLLLVVGDDAADEVGVGVPQGGHEVGELLFVQLAHRAEHALAGLEGSVHGVRHARHLVQAHDAVHWDQKHRRCDEDRPRYRRDRHRGRHHRGHTPVTSQKEEIRR